MATKTYSIFSPDHAEASITSLLHAIVQGNLAIMGKVVRCADEQDWHLPCWHLNEGHPFFQASHQSL